MKQSAATDILNGLALGLDIMFLIAYRCVACSVRHLEPWACLAHCRQFLCSVQVEFLPVHWCRGSNSGYMLRDTCRGYSLHKAVYLSEFSSANSSDKLRFRQPDSHVTTNGLSVEHVEEIFTSHVGSIDQFGYHAQDLCIFLDPLTGEECRPVSTHLLGTTRQRTQSAKNVWR